MDMTGEQVIPAPKALVWESLFDPAVLKAFKAEGFDVITDRHYDVVRNLGPLLKIDLARFQ